MYRRQFLALSTVTLAGCGQTETTPATDGVDADETATTVSDFEERTTPVVTPDPDDPVLFVLANDTDTRQTVQLTLTSDEETVLDVETTAVPGERIEYDPEISTPGQYELSVTLSDGRQSTHSFRITRYAVQNGSNHDIIITDDDVYVLVED